MTRLQNRDAADALALSRRSFLIGAAGTAVVFGFAPTEALCGSRIVAGDVAVRSDHLVQHRSRRHRDRQHYSR